MSSLVHQRCLNHATREAAAKCPSCGHFFCRECVTEHENRMTCANCLAAGTAEPEPRRRLNLAPVVLLAQAALGLMLLWFMFYGAGRLLLVMPSSFHEGTIWSDLADELAEDLD